MVPVLAGQQAVQQQAGRTSALHNSNTPAKRNGCATHGPHAQQYYTGHSRASCSHGGQERMLGAGHRPCFHRYRGEGGEPPR